MKKMKTEIGKKLTSFLNGKETFDTFINEVERLRQLGEDVIYAETYKEKGKVTKFTVACKLASKEKFEELVEWKKLGGDVTHAVMYPSGNKLTIAGVLAKSGDIEGLNKWKKLGENVTDARINLDRTKLTVAGELADKEKFEELVEWKKLGENVTYGKIFSSGNKQTVAGALAGRGNIEGLNKWKKLGENVTDAQINLGGTKLTVAGKLADKQNIEGLNEWKIKLTGGGEVTALGQTILIVQQSRDVYRESLEPIANVQNQGLGADDTKDVVFIDRNGNTYGANVQNQNGKKEYSIGDKTLRKMFFEGAGVSGLESSLFDPLRKEVQESILPQAAAIFGLLPQTMKKRQGKDVSTGDKDIRPILPKEVKQMIAEYFVGKTLASTYSKEHKGQTIQKGILPSHQDLAREGLCRLYIDGAHNQAFKNYREALPIDRRVALDSVPQYKEIAKAEFRSKLKTEIKEKDPDNSCISYLNGSKVPFDVYLTLKENGLSLESSRIFVDLVNNVDTEVPSAKRRKTENSGRGK